MPPKSKNAFTLIELLVVISVIALLMAILMPALSAAKKRAGAAVCLSNLKQIGIGVFLYAESNNHILPRGMSDIPGQVLWFDAFMPYLKDAYDVNDYRNVKIYRCPNYPNRNQTICYVINAWGWSTKTKDLTKTNEVCTPSHISVFRKPARMI